MLQLRMSPALEALVASLDDTWEAEIGTRLPFPVAYVLARMRAGGHEWDVLTKDLVTAIIRYLAVVGVSDYLHAGVQADLDLNEKLQKLAQPMVEGNWLAIVKACAARPGAHGFPEFAEAVRAVETGSLEVALKDPHRGLSTDRLGVLSSLLKVRNALFAHPVPSLTNEEKAHARPLVLTLVRAALHGLEPVWRCDFLATLGVGEAATLALRGTDGFVALDETLPTRCALRLPSGTVLPLEPLAFSEPARDGDGSLLDAQGELYVLNQLNRRRVPEYAGVAGGHVEKPDLAAPVSSLFDARRVWERRVDVELDEVLDYARRKAAARLAELEDEGVFDRGRYVRREPVEAALDAFVRDGTGRALFVAGASGSGKSTTVFDWVRRQVDVGTPALVLRAAELPADVVKRRRWTEHLSAELGTVRTIDEVLARAASGPSGRFLVVVDALNEFTAADRDASLLFASINNMLSDCRTRAALKLVVTARTDSLGQFLPNGRLPADAEEDVWTLVEGRPSLQVPAMTPEEGLALLASFGVEGDKARGIVQAAHPLSPDTLRKAAIGALGADDLRRMDDRGVTARVLDARFGRDDELRRVVEELVQVMGKRRDLSLEEDELQKSAPKLYARLRAGGDRLLTTLRELGILQVLPRVSEGSGEKTWALALSHDSLFEALTAGQRRKRLRFSMLFSVSVCLLLLVTLEIALRMMGGEVARQKVAVGPRVRAACLSYASESVPPPLRERFLAACGDVEAAALASGEAVAATVVGMLQNLTLAVLAAALLLFWANDLYSYWRASKSRRDPRVLFFGRSDELRAARDLQRVVWPLVIVTVAWTLFRIGPIFRAREAGTSGLVVALAPLFVLLLLLIVVALPVVVVLAHRRASRGSALLWDYRYHPDGAAGARRELIQLSVLLTLGVGGIAALCGLQGATFAPRTPLAEARAAIERLNRQADWQALGTWGPAQRVLSAQILDEVAADLAKKLDKSLIPRDDPDWPYVMGFLAACWLVTLSMMWGALLVTQRLAARRAAPAGASP